MRLGEWNTMEDPDCDIETICADPPIDVTPEEIICHPQYSDESRNKLHDIALIRLSRDVQFTGDDKYLHLILNSYLTA